MKRTMIAIAALTSLLSYGAMAATPVSQPAAPNSISAAKADGKAKSHTHKVKSKQTNKTAPKAI